MKDKLVAALVAIALVAAIIGGVLYSTRRNRVELTGKILKVRTQSLDNESSAALIDLRLRNPSTQQFMVKNVEAKLLTADGRTVDGGVFSDVETQRLLDYYPVLGPKYNPVLIAHHRINSGEEVDRTLAIRFGTTEQAIIQRKNMLITVKDADGSSTEINDQHK